jgi:hypothetical protein
MEVYIDIFKSTTKTSSRIQRRSISDVNENSYNE